MNVSGKLTLVGGTAQLFVDGDVFSAPARFAGQLINLTINPPPPIPAPPAPSPEAPKHFGQDLAQTPASAPGLLSGMLARARAQAQAQAPRTVQAQAQAQAPQTREPDVARLNREFNPEDLEVL